MRLLVSRSPAGAPEHHCLPRRRPNEAEQELDGSGLPRPVGAEKTKDFASFHRHRQPTEGYRAAELLSQLDCVDRRGADLARPGTEGAPVGASFWSWCQSATASADLLSDTAQVFAVEEAGDQVNLAVGVFPDRRGGVVGLVRQ